MQHFLLEKTATRWDFLIDHFILVKIEPKSGCSAAMSAFWDRCARGARVCRVEQSTLSSENVELYISLLLIIEESERLHGIAQHSACRRGLCEVLGYSGRMQMKLSYCVEEPLIVLILTFIPI